jgi:tetratricopeptide (TPR) repeat protein
MADDAGELIQQAIDRAEDGEFQAAIALLTRAIAIDATKPQAFFERAIALLDSQRDREALPDLDRALELDPRFPGARAWRARVLAGLREHGRAAEDWLRELRDHPDGPPGMGVNPQTWADCAEQFALAGDRAQAIELLEEYLREHATRVTSYARYETAPLRLLARLLSEAGDTARAEEMRQRARASPHRVPADG